MLSIQTYSNFDYALGNIWILICRILVKYALLHAKNLLSLYYISFLDTFPKGPILFAVQERQIQRFRRSRSRPLWYNCPICRSISDCSARYLSTYLTSVFTYMPKFSQAHNHWVWKISCSKGLTQYHLCTPIFHWLCWKLWSCRKYSVRQHNFSLEFQIKGVRLAFSITFKWKNIFFASYPHVVCCFMPFPPLFEDVFLLFYNRNLAHPQMIWGFYWLPIEVTYCLNSFQDFVRCC